MSETERIGRFWRWWVEHSADIDEAIDAGNAAELGSEISAQVDALHPDLQWELTPGGRAKHALCVSSGGMPELRPLAERWVRAAPKRDATWEYHPARIPDPSVFGGGFEFQLEAYALDLSETTVGIHIDDERRLIDVQVHHPAFREMSDEACGQVTFLVLDWLLGEDGVERWIGSVEFVVDRPADALGLDALVDTAQGLASRNDEVSWVLLEWQHDDGSVALATARRPLKWIDHPLLDQHIAVLLPYSRRNPAGLPEPAALDWLRAAEDDLVAELGEDALLVAHETTNGLRTLHFYADSQYAIASERVTTWTKQIRDAAVEVSLDSGWHAVRRFA